MSGRTVGAVESLHDLASSDHACWIVASAEDFSERARAFLAAADAAGQNAMLLTPRPGSVRFGDVALLEPPASPEPSAVLDMFRRETAAAREMGCEGVRVLADMDWVGTASLEQLVALELLLDRALTGLDATVVCAYRTDTFDAATIAGADAVHPCRAGTAPADLGFRVWSAGADSWEVSGEIDLASAEAFAQALSVAASASESMRLGLGRLSFIDLAGIRAIAGVVRSHPDVAFTLARTSETFRHCWELLDLPAALPAVTLA